MRVTALAALDVSALLTIPSPCQGEGQGEGHTSSSPQCRSARSRFPLPGGEGIGEGDGAAPFISSQMRSSTASVSRTTSRLVNLMTRIPRLL